MLISGCFAEQSATFLALGAYAQSPIGWAVALGALGLWLLVPRSGRQSSLQGLLLSMIQGVKRGAGRLGFLRLVVLPVLWSLEVLVRNVGIVLSIASLCLFALSLASLGSWTGRNLFWVLAAVTIVSAGATVTMRSPVYSAIWFAMTLLGTAGLFFQQGSQFLAVATVVVYAGAILVTFLFVLMLAQPEGRTTYDRIGWGQLPAALSSLVGASIVGLLTITLANLGDGSPQQLSSRSEIQASLASDSMAKSLPQDVNTEEHMAHLGAELFSRHLISIEVAGSLLLVALVGAVAIVIQGNDRVAKGGDSGDE